jgi:hypothetical protein
MNATDEHGADWTWREVLRPRSHDDIPGISQTAARRLHQSAADVVRHRPRTTMPVRTKERI